MIEITKELIKQRFEEYNKAYFNNELPKCKCSVYNTKWELGLYVRDWIRIAKKPKNISPTAVWTEELFKGTLIHEMVHHYVVAVKGKRSIFSPHGLRFRRKCWELKRKYNIDIEIGIFIKRYAVLRQQDTLTLPNRVELVYLRFFNYLLSWVF